MAKDATGTTSTSDSLMRYGIATGAALLAYATVWEVRITSGADLHSYQASARDIAHGWHSMADRPPGYPLLLWMTGSLSHPSTLLFLVQLMMHGATVLLAISLGRRLGLPRRVCWALCVLLLAPPAVAYVAAPLSENLATFSVMLVATAAVRWFDRRGTVLLLALGALCGWLALVRPTFELIFLPIALIVGSAARREGQRIDLKAAALVCLSATIVMGPVVAWNGSQFGQPVLTPLMPYNLATKTAPFVESMPDGKEDLEDAIIRARVGAASGSSFDRTPYLWLQRDALSQATGRHGSALDRYVLMAELDLIAREPSQYLRSVATAAGAYVLIDVGNGPPLTQGAPGVLWGAIHILLLGAFLVQLTIIGGLILLRKISDSTRYVLTVCYAIIVYNALVSITVDTGSGRYRVPTDPLILVAMAFGLYAAWRARSTERPSGIA